MGLDPTGIGTIAGAATGIISGITGLFQNARAKKLAKANVRPVYDIPKEITTNQNLAQTMANQGLPGTQYAQQMQGIGRSANNAIGAAQTRRGGLGSIGAIQQGTNDAMLNLNVADSQQRMSNIRNLMQQNNVMGQYRDKQWGWNNQAKYEENAAAVRALRTAGNANINTAFNSIIGAGAQAAGGSLSGLGGGAAPKSTQPSWESQWGGKPPGNVDWSGALPYNDTLRKYP